MELKILFIEDDSEWKSKLLKIFHNKEILNYKLVVQVEESFENGQKLIVEGNFDIVILDLFKDGNPTDEDAGKRILDQIRQLLFVPVIFFTGHAYKIEDIRSEVIGIVNKSEGIDALISEIKRIIGSKLALLRRKINDHVNGEIKKYFWETIDQQKNIFSSTNIDYSLGYLFLRRIASSLSKEHIKEILEDDKIKIDKVHPMEFYLYPPPANITTYETGEILKKDGRFYAILTPDCDMIPRTKKHKRKAEFVLLTTLTRFKLLPEYLKLEEIWKKRKKTQKDEEEIKNLKGKLKNWMTNREGPQDRYFFLPATPFIEDMVLDFQDQVTIKYTELDSYKKIAKLDMPFAQSMISSFIRYYNRIGFPEIDTDFMINNLLNN